MPDISLRQLETFVVTAEYGSFTKAAENLHMTQSTVSMHIQGLEAALEKRLILRGARRRFELTEEGERIYHAARDILARCEALAKPAHEDGSTYLLSIATSTVPAQCLLPALLRAFRTRYDRARYTIRRGDSARVFQLLDDGKARIGLVGDEPDGKLYQYDVIARDHLVVITQATDEFRELLIGDATGAELLDRPLIRREEGSGTDHAAEFWCRKNGVRIADLNVIARMDNPEDIKRSVAAGMGVAVISDLAVQQEVRDGKLLAFPLGGEGSSRAFYVVRRKDVLLTPIEGRFVEMSRTELAGIAGV